MPASAKRQNTLHKGWTKEDDERLREVMSQGTPQSWAEIAQAAFPNDHHDSTACMDRWKALNKPRVHKGPWTAAEDNALVALVHELGAEKWVAIASRLNTRSGKQCRERWHNHLDPAIKKGPFTPEEDSIIFDLYSKIGSKWAEIARSLPGRPDNAIKNHFNTSLNRSKRRSSSTSVSSTASSGGKSASPKLASRYSPYKARKRNGSVASVNNVPISPSPLSPRASRSSSPADVRSASGPRRPNFNLSLGRNLDKDFFSPARHAATGFIPSGPLTAPAGDRFWPGGPIDPASVMPPQSYPMQATRSSGSSYGPLMSDINGLSLASGPNSASSSSLSHSLSTNSLEYSSASSSPSSPPPGFGHVHPMFADDYDPYAQHRFSYSGVSPPRAEELQRTASLPCYTSLPGFPSVETHPFITAPFSPHKPPDPSQLTVEVEYQPSDIAAYFHDPAAYEPFGMAPPEMYMQQGPMLAGREPMHAPLPHPIRRQSDPLDKERDSRTPVGNHRGPPPPQYSAGPFNSPQSSDSSGTVSAPVYEAGQASGTLASPGSLAFNQASQALQAALPSPASVRSSPSMHQILSTPQQQQQQQQKPMAKRMQRGGSPKAFSDTVPFTNPFTTSMSPISPPSHAPDYMGSPSFLHQPQAARAAPRMSAEMSATPTTICQDHEPHASH